MKTLLVALNAQYFHTNLAVRSIAGYCAARGVPAAFEEYTINQRAEQILPRLYAAGADVYLFSCYLWNVALVRQLAASLRKLRPGAFIAVGGPQVSYHAGAFLAQNPAVNAVVAGEGEAAVLALLRALAQGRPGPAALAACPGLVWRQGGAVVCNPPPPPLALDELPFPYEDGAPAGRILYYESMRGCPFRCSYCLSPAEAGLRMKSLPPVQKELARLLALAPAQVKLVDRTFNCDKARALAIWRFLQQHDNGTTNFHFELAGEALDDETLAFLATVRPGLFQFEVGVQSANPETLREVGRPANPAPLLAKAARLRKAGNIHLHLDLIAALPYEDYDSFAASFNRVYALRPHQLQLGFLKVLGGSAMEVKAAEYGLVYDDAPPFEALYTKWLSFEELVRLKSVAAMVELYYNSGRFAHIVEELQAQYPTPFAFYEALAGLWQAGGHDDAPLGKTGHYQLLGALAPVDGAQNLRAQWLCRFDLLLHEKPRALPAWVRVNGALPHRGRCLAFYAQQENLRRYLPHYAGMEPKQLLKTAHIEVFPFHPATGAAGEHAFLFDYAHRDIMGRAAHWQITLPQ